MLHFCRKFGSKLASHHKPVKNCPNHVQRTKSSIKKRIILRRSVRSMFGRTNIRPVRNGLNVVVHSCSCLQLRVSHIGLPGGRCQHPLSHVRVSQHHAVRCQFPWGHQGHWFLHCNDSLHPLHLSQLQMDHRHLHRLHDKLLDLDGNGGRASGQYLCHVLFWMCLNLQLVSRFLA